MEHSFWLKRWQDADTGFHRANVHPMLEAHWAEMKHAKGSLVFVPLCGRSSDMVWLAEQGHNVVGAELSSLAIDSFFDGLNLTPTVQDNTGLTLKTAGPFKLWEGDVLELTRSDVGAIAAVYDRAALVALPPDIQTSYAKLLTQLMPAGSQIFLISLCYDQKEMNGPPFSISEEKIERLFAKHFEITCRTTNSDALDDSQNLKQRGLTTLTESLYILTRRHEIKPV